MRPEHRYYTYTLLEFCTSPPLGMLGVWGVQGRFTMRSEHLGESTTRGIKPGDMLHLMLLPLLATAIATPTQLPAAFHLRNYTWPTLPKQQGGLDGRQRTHCLRWSGLGVA